EGISIARLSQQGGRPPIPLHQPLPRYTDFARQFRIEGTILLKGIIIEDGSVVNLRCIRNLGWGLDEAAILQVQDRWKFEPATLNGRPLPVEANIEVSFRLY
ncbi:MAG: energy transducer TonB, partial [Acidobacteriota bacterium]